MDGLHIILAVLIGVVTSSQDQISGSTLEVTVRPGDNITLYCDCKTSPGVYIVWYRNCSHENQPSLILRTRTDIHFHSYHVKVVFENIYLLKISSRFQFVRNNSSDSYDLLIMNTTDSEEGLYYCGTEQTKLEGKEYLTSTRDYTYGNITTRIIFNSSSSGVPAVSWMMVFTPAFTILSSFLSFILVYHFCQKTDKEPQILHKRPDTRGQTRQNQDEDMCLTRVVFRAKHKHDFKFKRSEV